MCPGIFFHSHQSKIYQSRISPRIKSLLLLFTGVIFVFSLKAQDEGTPVEIPTLDMRGRPPIDASYAAIKSSEKNIVVLLIRGGSQELIDNVTGKMKALYHRGYTRIGIILCDLDPDEVGPVLGVVVDNMPYAVIKKAKPDTITCWKIYNLVRDAYEEFILPKANQNSVGN